MSTGGKRPGAGRPTALDRARNCNYYLEPRHELFLLREAKRRGLGLSATLRAVLDERIAAEGRRSKREE